MNYKSYAFHFLKFFLACLIGRHETKVASLMQLRVFAQKSQSKRLGVFLENRFKSIGLHISQYSKIDASLKLPHAHGIVIGRGVEVSEDVVIFQNVTLGGARLGDWEDRNYPSIGRGTIIFAGAVIIGRVKIGENCVIGANAVVVTDVPDNSTFVGIPARSKETKQR